MYMKFEALMNKYMMPLMNKLNEDIHLTAMKKAMSALVPLLVIGSVSLLPQGMIYLLGDGHVISLWLSQYLDLFYLPYIMGIGLISLYVTAALAYHLSSSYQEDIPISIIISMIAFFILSVELNDQGEINKIIFGPQGIFAAIVSSILAVELYHWCKGKHMTIRLPQQIPEFVSASFEMIFISIVIAGVFLIMRILCIHIFHCVPAMLVMNVLAPLIHLLDYPLGYTFLKLIQCFLFFFGIHPVAIGSITSPISTQFLAENIMNCQSGLEMTHIYTPGIDSAFGNLSGTGITFGLVFWCLFSKKKALKDMGSLALVPSLFGVNEPILFGAPVVLNPIFFIPFVIGGGLIGSIGGWAQLLGIMRHAFFAPPYIGLFFEGFFTNFDVMSFVVNAIQLILSILIWYPFIKYYEKHYEEEK